MWMNDVRWWQVQGEYLDDIVWVEHAVEQLFELQQVDPDQYPKFNNQLMNE